MTITQILLNGMIAGSIYAMVALGFTIIYKTVHFFHFAHGAVLATGAYCAYSLSVSIGLNFILSFFLATLFAAVIGVISDRVVYLPLRKSAAPRLVFLIASFGIFIFIQNLLQLVFGAQVLTLRSGPVKEGHQMLGAVITDVQILLLVVTSSLLGILWQVVDRTKMGKAIRAVADDSEGASVAGIYPEQVILFAFGIGSALAGMAGILISLETNIEPTMGMNTILKGIIASIIGGIGSIPGAVLGGFFLGIVENLGIWKIQAGWKDTIAFAVLILFLLFRSEGFLGKRNSQERL
jgi:branched-chain amino acid transport system permease protein